MNSEKDFLESRVNNLVMSAQQKGYARFSLFLEETQIALASNYLKMLKFNNFIFFGGTQNSQRKMLGAFPEFIKPCESLFPIIALKIKYNKNYELNHRDFLGALMALQIKREVIGDIIVMSGETIIFIKDDIAQFVISNITKIGKVGVAIAQCDGSEAVVQQDFLEIKGSVSSMRLDCIVALLINKSRTNAVLAINGRLVKVNSFENVNVSLTIKSGDIIAIKGYGKFIVKGDPKETKKGKFFICIDKYL